MAEPANINELEELTPEQINAHLARKDSEHPCEACGHDQWVMETHQDNTIVFLHAPVLAKPGSLVYLPLLCNSCGNTRLINAAMMIREIHSHEKQFENVGD